MKPGLWYIFLFPSSKFARSLEHGMSSKSKENHIIYHALSVPHVYRIPQVQWCWWCLFWKWCLTVQCFSFATEGIQPCKPRCPKVNALVWIPFGTLTILISDLCIAEMRSWVLSKMFNDCTESQVGQGSNPSQLRSALKKSKPESSVKQRFGHTQLAWLFDCQRRVDVPWNQGFDTFSYFHHLSLPEVWNMAYQVSGKKCQHIIYMHSVSNMSTGFCRSSDVDGVFSESDA